MNKDYCINCRDFKKYSIVKKPFIKNVRGKKYTFSFSTALCSSCGSSMDIPGIIDLNIKEFDEQYRCFENIVSIDDINKLMKLYNIGKIPLSLVLGFGEITITRYLEGQIPSKEYSDIIKSALSSTCFMKKQLMKNRDKITKVAYNKAFKTVCELERIYSFSDKLRSTIARLFNNLNEITPLGLQKLLYFCQGFSLALQSKPLFNEDCKAWTHGPVYEEIYHLFKDFVFNPIDDERFSILNNGKDTLSKEEKQIIDLVSATFGSYSGKMLELITHIEAPWKKTKTNCVITKDIIKKYFKSVNQKYDLSTEAGTNKYIASKLKDKSRAFVSPK